MTRDYTLGNDLIFKLSNIINAVSLRPSSNFLDIKFIDYLTLNDISGYGGQVEV